MFCVCAGGVSLITSEECAASTVTADEAQQVGGAYRSGWGPRKHVVRDGAMLKNLPIILFRTACSNFSPIILTMFPILLSIMLLSLASLKQTIGQLIGRLRQLTAASLLSTRFEYKLCLLVLVLLLNLNAHSNVMGVTTTPTNYVTIILQIMLGKKFTYNAGSSARILAASLVSTCSPCDLISTHDLKTS